MDKEILQNMSLIILSFGTICLNYVLMTKGWGLEVNNWHWLIGCFLGMTFIYILGETISSS